MDFNALCTINPNAFPYTGNLMKTNTSGLPFHWSWRLIIIEVFPSIPSSVLKNGCSRNKTLLSAILQENLTSKFLVLG